MTHAEYIRAKTAEIDAAAGGRDWSDPRVRLYITASLAALQAALDATTASLTFEREVNSRVMSVLRIGDKL